MVKSINNITIHNNTKTPDNCSNDFIVLKWTHVNKNKITANSRDIQNELEWFDIENNLDNIANNCHWKKRKVSMSLGHFALPSEMK